MGMQIGARDGMSLNGVGNVANEDTVVDMICIFVHTLQMNDIQQQSEIKEIYVYEIEK